MKKEKLRCEVKQLRSEIQEYFKSDSTLDLDCCIDRAKTTMEMHNWFVTMRNHKKTSNELVLRWKELLSDTNTKRLSLVRKVNEKVFKYNKLILELSRKICLEGISNGKKYSKLRLCLYGFDKDFVELHGE